MPNIFLDFFNSLINPKNIFNVTKKSFFIPFLISLFYLFSPVFLRNIQILEVGRFDVLKIKLLIFILLFSYLSSGIRMLFCSESNLLYAYISSVSPVILGLLGKPFLYFSVLWVILLRFYIDLKKNNYYSLIIGIVFDLFLVWWLL
ncbi:hypothetical protein AA80_03485 [Petrotoga sibirica DSM 13575]|uniref:Uncharacterized protein n=2 Tax=Petrotoga sibirica TaxID=156202 RepID=A0A4R8EXP1_9BACT|nr:MAG: Uncharacterized protein XD96_0782 [Petrotoga mobilis]POZ88946.1 hypothetical protein AA80_03485 [Petrotoga sibirica DSM 13575]POZ91183.1 hypothetical protein AD60_04305 [Petrotoga sp. SL27]TDX15535.1 hypothetical protein C8D74_10618 [Petrotoga sibirica]